MPEHVATTNPPVPDAYLAKWGRWMVQLEAATRPRALWLQRRQGDQLHCVFEGGDATPELRKELQAIADRLAGQAISARVQAVEPSEAPNCSGICVPLCWPDRTVFGVLVLFAGSDTTVQLQWIRQLIESDFRTLHFVRAIELHKNNLESRIAERTEELRSLNAREQALSSELREINATLETKVTERTRELEATLTNLRRTQDDLIQAEKLSALSGMVAGIAHELNTPIGNTVTVASTMLERANQLQTLVETGAVKKSELVNGIVAVREMAQLLEKSANRAASLIASFKEVAVDQVSERRRSFDLREVVEENLQTMRPSLKHTPWVLNNNVPPDIVCDSFPGPLGQVLTNLIQNAILHGFSGRSTGTVDISARVQGDSVEIVVADDGVGMDTATAARVFEPFFTTKLGHGGSGLGLAICFRIVATILAGDIRSQSAPGSGTQFRVRMPLRTPGKA